jgi:hypothetical protein
VYNTTVKVMCSYKNWGAYNLNWLNVLTPIIAFDTKEIGSLL